MQMPRMPLPEETRKPGPGMGEGVWFGYRQPKSTRQRAAELVAAWLRGMTRH